MKKERTTEPIIAADAEECLSESVEFLDIFSPVRRAAEFVVRPRKE